MSNVMHLEPVAVRSGAVPDAENLAALATQVWLHTYATAGISSAISRYVLSEFTPVQFISRFGDPNALILVAEVNDHLVGYVQVKFGSPAGPKRTSTEVATLYVQEHFARRGVGRSLLQAAQAEVRRRTGSSAVWLCVNSKNERAIQFYQKLGFVQEGIAYFELGGERHQNNVLFSEGA